MPLSLGSRRAIALSLGAAALSLSAPSAQADTPAQRRVVVWHADDCGPCRLWLNGDRRPEFEALAGPALVQWVSVHKPLLASSQTDYRWPDDAATLRAQMAALPVPTLTPTFDFVCNGQLERRLQGLAAWDSYWRSQTRALAKDCQAP